MKDVQESVFGLDNTHDFPLSHDLPHLRLQIALLDQQLGLWRVLDLGVDYQVFELLLVHFL